MIAPDKSSLWTYAFNEDFTIQSYRSLLLLAKRNYEFASYTNIPWGKKFVTWRHDCDLSLNRSLSLAKIESENGVSATYFVNPHCEFYNLFEKSQHRLVLEILSMGHEIGLHFDAEFYDISDETSLDEQVSAEAAQLEQLFSCKLTAFSFHNPVAANLRCEAETYGGLVNCYSKRFKDNVPYCSDSNGYWRYRRLYDVISEASDPCLQVLTHPDWWQDIAMPPRQRIFRSVYGRAESLMRRNDALLEAYDRPNHAGAAETLRFLKATHPRLFELCDYLWNSGHLQSLFVELWRLHELQINKLCKAVFRKEWRVPASQVNKFFDESHLRVDGWKLFKAVFSISWHEAAGVSKDAYRDWIKLRNQLIHGRASASREQLNEGAIFLCRGIQGLAAWGECQPINFDGIRHLGSIGIPTCKTAEGNLSDRLEELAEDIQNFPKTRWQRFKIQIQQGNPLIKSL